MKSVKGLAKQFHWGHGLDKPDLNTITFDNRGTKSDRHRGVAENISEDERHTAIWERKRCHDRTDGICLRAQRSL